ncbi:hypothetical protein M422DRAFT_51639 [Sphaerobolus stellatus SS14]|uniref:F-box domain-containing protein n=1 Tax=Sphaerobolus stellatus (strain SS14) TaxID=990650 RepID=A0A0C9UJU2_SPHS4|nr:hypothetical protein M422DRAFT_51639 [Sphaerobolus stellatus SS14]
MASWRALLLNSFQLIGLRGIDFTGVGLEPPYPSSLMEDFLRRHPSLETVSIPFTDEDLPDDISLLGLLPRLKIFEVSSLTQTKLWIYSAAMRYRLTAVSARISASEPFPCHLGSLRFLPTMIFLSQLPDVVQNVPNLIGLRLSVSKPPDHAFDVGGERWDAIPVETTMFQLAKLKSLKYFCLDARGGYSMFIRALAEKTAIEHLQFFETNRGNMRDTKQFGNGGISELISEMMS